MDGTNDETVRQAARQIMPHLDTLLGRQVAESVGAELRAALGDDTNEGPARIREVLGQYAATREWMRSRVDWDRSSVRNYKGLPGLSPGVVGERYACPICGSTWFRPSVDDPIPPCEKHDVPRVRSGG
jgi:hypothetical protein